MADRFYLSARSRLRNLLNLRAKRCGMFYVNHRWLGGTLTNYKTIKKRIDLLFELEQMETDGTFDVLP